MTDSRKKALLTALCFLGTLLLLLLICFIVTDGKVSESAISFYFDGSWWDDNWQMHDSLDGITFTFKPYGTTIAIGALLALLVSYLLTGRKDTSRFCVFSFLSVAGGLLLSRLFYCVVCPFYYVAHNLPPWTPLRFWDGGMSMVGALLGLLLAGVIVPDRRRSAAIAAPLFIAAARIAEHFSGQIGYGASVDFTGLLAIEGAWSNRLNVHLIETIMALVIFCAVLLLPILLRNSKAHDLQLPTFLVLYGISQILMESLRKDEHMVWGFVKAQMLFCLLLAMTGMAIVCYEGRPLHDLKRNKWGYVLLVSLCTALPVIAFEFALDKSNIPNELIYAAYVLVLLFFIVMFFRRMMANARYNRCTS